MQYSERLISELKQEAALTRSVLERVPEDKLSWKPHAKSMSLGQLALHIAGVPGGIAELLDVPVREMPVVPLTEAVSVHEILAALDQYVTLAESKLRAWGDGSLMETWKLTSQGVTIMEAQRIEVVRTLMLNHWYHHRGQLTVYLRMLEVPLPSIYGPSADER